MNLISPQAMISCKKNKESLLTCLILNRDCLQKKNTKISSVKYKSEASDDKVEKTI